MLTACNVKCNHHRQQQDRPCMYNVTLRHLHIFVVWAFIPWSYDWMQWGRKLVSSTRYGHWHVKQSWLPVISLQETASPRARIVLISVGSHSLEEIILWHWDMVKDVCCMWSFVLQTPYSRMKPSLRSILTVVPFWSQSVQRSESY